MRKGTDESCRACGAPPGAGARVWEDARRRGEPEVRVLSINAILGYGFPMASFEAALARDPELIAADGGSTDPGPYYLGEGVSFTSRAAVKRDLVPMLQACKSRRIPVLIGTSGGSGARPHLEWQMDIIREICREQGLRFRAAVIHADVPGELVKRRIREGRVMALGPAEELTEEVVDESINIVGQMGVEPFVAALEEGAELVVAGRASDPAMFAVLPVMRGYPWGLSLHMGKILECGALAATPAAAGDCVMGYLRKDHFLLEATNPTRRCTVTSVSSHSLYEKSDPYSLPGPGGTVDLTNALFEQYGDQADGVVRVSGATYQPTPRYYIKLEAARKIGYRTICVAGARDPLMVRAIDEVIAGVTDRVRDNFRDIDPGDYHLMFHIYGKDGVMGDLEPQKEITSHELGIVIEVVARTQEMASLICGFTRSNMLHYGYKGRIATAGNLAFLYSPSDLQAGVVYEFSMNHLIEVKDGTELFPMEMVEVG